MTNQAAPAVETGADDFGRLLLALRRERGISRVTLGAAAGCSRQYIEMLETRDRQHPSPQIVSAIAGALLVEGAERERLFAAAGMSMPLAPPLAGLDVQQLVSRLVTDLPAPAAVVDAEWWLLGWNRAFTETFDLAIGALPAGGTHLLQVWLEPPARRQVLNWDEFVPGLIATFRWATGEQSRTVEHERTLAALRTIQRFAELYRGARKQPRHTAPPPLCYRDSVRGPAWFQPAVLSAGRGRAVSALIFLPAVPASAASG